MLRCSNHRGSFYWINLGEWWPDFYGYFLDFKKWTGVMEKYIPLLAVRKMMSEWTTKPQRFTGFIMEKWNQMCVYPHDCLDWLVQVLEDDTHRVHHGQLWRIGLTGEMDLNPPNGVLQWGCRHLSLFLPFKNTDGKTNTLLINQQITTDTSRHVL